MNWPAGSICTLMTRGRAARRPGLRDRFGDPDGPRVRPQRGDRPGQLQRAPAGYPALGDSRGYSEHTQWLVDQEVTALLTKAETRARDLLTSHREALAQLTAALLEQETVTGDQVRALAWAFSMTTASEPPLSTKRISR